MLIEQSRLSEADNNGCAVGGVEGGRGWNRLPGGSRSVCCKAGGRFRGLQTLRVVNEAECQRWEVQSSDRSIHNRISDLTRRSQVEPS